MQETRHSESCRVMWHKQTHVASHVCCRWVIRPGESYCATQILCGIDRALHTKTCCGPSAVWNPTKDSPFMYEKWKYVESQVLRNYRGAYSHQGGCDFTWSGNKFRDLSVFVIVVLVVTLNQARRTLPFINQNSLLTISVDHKITVLMATNFWTEAILDFLLEVCLSVHRCICAEKKNQLHATEWFIALIICPACFGHFYAHNQELETIHVLLPPMVCDALVAGCRRAGAEQQAMHLTSDNQQPRHRTP